MKIGGVIAVKRLCYYHVLMEAFIVNEGVVVFDLES